MNNNFGTPYGGTFNGTTYGNTAPTQPTMTQLLTPEEIGKIRKSPQAIFALCALTKMKKVTSALKN